MTRLFLFFCFLSAFAEAAWANGLLIYKEQGFHTDEQAKIIEYVTAEVIPQSATVILKTGKRLDVPSGRSPVLIPYTDVPIDKPEEVVKIIDSAMGRFPQHGKRLEGLRLEWLAKIERPAPRKPSEEAPGATFKTRNGVEYSGVTDIKAMPNGLTINHREGVTKVSFYNLTDEQIKHYHLNRASAEEYSAQQKKFRRQGVAAQNQRVNERLRAKEDAELETEYGIDTTGIAIQVIPGKGVLYRGGITEDFIEIERRVEDCLANHSSDPKYPKRMIDVKVKRQREIPIGEQATNLSFIECSAEGLSEGDKIAARLYRIGTYPYTDTLGTTRAIPCFTKDFEKLREYRSRQKEDG